MIISGYSNTMANFELAIRMERVISDFWESVTQKMFIKRIWCNVCMMTSSNGNIYRVTGHLCGELACPRLIPEHKGQWRGAFMFSLIHAQ